MLFGHHYDSYSMRSVLFKVFVSFQIDACPAKIIPSVSRGLQPVPTRITKHMTPKFVKFLIFLLLINTLLFTLADWHGFSLLWVVLFELFVFLLVVVFIVAKSPARRLQRQAAVMGWSLHKMEADHVTGYKDVVYQRDGVFARVSWQRGTVFLVGENVEFKNFADLEHWLAG